MLKAIPWPPVAKRSFWQACQWQRCIYSIHHFRKRCSVTYKQKRCSVRGGKIIVELNRAWTNAIRSTRKMVKPPTRQTPTILASSGLPFFSAPTIWAINMGFSEDPVTQWFHSRDEHPALPSETENPLLGFPLVAVSRPAWARSLRFRQGLLTRLLHLAKKAIHFKVRKTSVDRLAQRRSALRNNDISIWARLIKPVGRTAAGFATSWFLTPEGVRRICRSEAEAREGARQEWAQLMVEGSPK